MTLLGFNWVDGIIILFFAFFIFNRRNKGLLHETLDLLGFMISLILALSFYRPVGNFLVAHFSITGGFANALGFLLLAFLSEPFLFILFSFAARLIPESVVYSKANKILFFIPAAISAIILIAFILTAALSLPIQPTIKQAIATSQLGGIITDQTSGFEKKLGDAFGGAVQDSLNFLTVEPKSEESVNLNFKTTAVSTDTDSEKVMFTLVNNERISRGIKALIFDTKLQDVGRQHCTDMFANGYFSHYTPTGKSPFDRMQSAGIEYMAAGENLAYAPTVEIAHKGLMESPGHRANILSTDFGKVGISVIDAGIYGKMFCQEFTN